MAGEQVTAFAQEWFTELSERAPVSALLARVRDSGLEMVFPERTLTSHAEFAEWYGDVGTAYTNQTHAIESLVEHDRDGEIDVDATVVWAGVDTADDRPFAFRVNQRWTLLADPDGLRILRYRVVDVSPADAPADASADAR